VPQPAGEFRDQAMIYLPLTLDGSVAGVIGLFHRKSLPFQWPSGSALQRYANEASSVYGTWINPHYRGEFHGATREMCANPSDGPSRNSSASALKRSTLTAPASCAS